MNEFLEIKEDGKIPQKKYLNPLREYYDKLPIIDRKKEFVERVVKETGKNETTIYRWINGEFQPASKLERELIARITRISERKLFPQTDKL